MPILDPADLLAYRRHLARKYPLVETRVHSGGREWTLTVVQDQDALVDLIESEYDLEHFPYGLMLWASALGLAERLCEIPNWITGKTVLELGAGVGLPGLAARCLRGVVMQTDHQKAALSLARINAANNGIEGIRYLLADWRAFDHEEQHDVVIGSDILYERTLHYELSRVLPPVLAPGGKLLISDPVRPQAMEFIDRMERDGWQFTMESRHVPWEGEQKEIVLYEATRPNQS